MEFLSALFGGILIIAMVATIICSFVFDGIILFVSSIVLHIEDKTKFFWKHIWKVWIFGGLANILTLFMLNFINVDNITFALTILAACISGGLTFIFHYFLTFQNDEERIRKILSAVFAVIAFLTSF